MIHTPLLSVVIPAYNEAATIRDLVHAVQKSPLDKEIIVVDDCSTDGTSEELAAIADTVPGLRVFRHQRNRGKGAALRTGFAEARGRFVIVQDADLEYDPEEYPKVLKPLIDGKADVVYGSRFAGGEEHRVLYFWHYVGNRFLTLLSNGFTDLNLTDMETCYKAFRREIIQSIAIEEDRFGFEPEITAKIAKLRCRVYEVGISYSGRTYEQGKKIGWKDGVRAVYCILRYNLRRSPELASRSVRDEPEATPAFDAVVEAAPSSAPPRSFTAVVSPAEDGQARVSADGG